MSANNCCHLNGRLTKNVEMLKTATGKSIVKFTLAVYRNKEKSDFVNCIAWENTALFMQSRFKKGSLIAVEGEIQTRTYDDSTGTRHWITEVLVQNVSPLEAKQKVQSVAQNDFYTPQTNEFEDYGQVITDDMLPY